MKQFIFMIDTNSYVGHFFKAMCAYCTGHIGDCGVGYYHAQRFKEEMGEDTYDFFDNVGIEINGWGFSYPVKMMEDENNTLGIIFKTEPTPSQIEILKIRSEEYAIENEIKIIGYRLKRITISEEIIPI